MPMNEAAGYRTSNLTEKQKREAMQAVYGLTERETMSPITELTYEERIKMRRMLDALDQKEAGGLKDFDLNKPPVPPYVYREYPILMYHHGTSQNRPAGNYEERQRMLAEGWVEDPFPAGAAPEIPLTAAEHAEAADIDRRLEKKRRL
jgi:hypothetical protein